MGLSTLRIGVAVWSCAFAACAAEAPDLASSQSALDISPFVLPDLSESARAQIVHRYDHLDPSNLVPRGLLEDTILFFDVNKAHVPKTAYFVVIDLSLFSGKDRFWLVDLASGAVEPHHTSHGDGSDPDNDGYATRFSNVPGSQMSSLGFYLTGEIYDGTHLHSMKLDGLTPDGSPNGMGNTNARSRAIVVHEADYVDDAVSTRNGRSQGCPALDPSIEVGVVDRIHGGSLVYIDTKPLNTPVGRASCGDATCDGAETADSCPVDCAEPVIEDEPPPDGGGCSTGHGAGSGASLLLGLALFGARRRRRP